MQSSVHRAQDRCRHFGRLQQPCNHLGTPGPFPYPSHEGAYLTEITSILNHTGGKRRRLAAGGLDVGTQTTVLDPSPAGQAAAEDFVDGLQSGTTTIPDATVDTGSVASAP